MAKENPLGDSFMTPTVSRPAFKFTSAYMHVFKTFFYDHVFRREQIFGVWILVEFEKAEEIIYYYTSKCE